ncbi:MAG: hypothetical protein NC394_03300 [Bacteroides sp.]|nr:hypothetical protein [Bacteroides sp.]
MFDIIKLLAIIALIAVLVIYFGKIKQKEKSTIVGLIICTIISAVISNWILNMIPLPTDKVIVTATGEKNKEASSNEIYITNLLIGGEEYELKKPSEGKWFWKGKNYTWRNENDTRQPEGTTRSITLDLPYGRDRSIQFGLSKWNGIVEVTYDGNTKSYDLFKSDDMTETILYAPIPDTNTFPLYAAKLLRVGLLVLFVILLMAYPVYAVEKFSYDCIWKWFTRNWDKLYYITVALAGLIVTFIIGKDGTLWRDEVWNIGWVYDGFPYLSFSGILQTVWFNIMPYGQEYLLLLSEIWIAIMVYVFGLIGAELKSKRLGVIMSTLGATSSTIIFQGSMEFRCYPMVILGMALSVYFFIKKQKNIGNEKISVLIFYGLSLAIVMDSHTFGLVTAGLMMIFDFIIVIVKKRYKNFIEFIIPAIYGVYWLFTTFALSIEGMQTGKRFAASTPSVKSIINFVYYLCGSNWLYVALFIFGYTLVVGYLIYRIYKKQFNLKSDYTSAVFVLVPPLLFAVIIIITNTIINGSIFNQRYFVPIIVFFEIFIAVAIDTLIQLLNENQSFIKNFASMALTLSACVYMCVMSWNNQSADTRDNYNAISDYLMGQNDIYSPTTVTVVRGNTNINSGFEYYLSHKGERDSINHIDMYTDFTSYDTVYVAYPGYPYDEATYTDKGYKKVDLNTSLDICKYVRE